MIKLIAIEYMMHSTSTWVQKARQDTEVEPWATLEKASERNSGRPSGSKPSCTDKQYNLFSFAV